MPSFIVVALALGELGLLQSVDRAWRRGQGVELCHLALAQARKTVTLGAGWLGKGLEG